VAEDAARPIALEMGIPARFALGPAGVTLRLPADAPLADLSVAAPSATALALRLVETAAEGPRPRKVLGVPAGERVRIPAVRVPADGLILECLGAGATAGEVEVALDAAPLDPDATLAEPDDLAPLDLPTATATLRGTIAPAGDRDFLRLAGRSALAIAAPADLAIVVDLVAPGPTDGVRLHRTIRLDAGEEVEIAAFGLDGGRPLVAIRAAEPGAASDRPYELRVAPPEPTADIEPNDDLASASRLPVGASAGALDSAADRDCFRLGPEAATATATLTIAAQDGPIAVTVFTVAPSGATHEDLRVEVSPLDHPLVLRGLAAATLALELRPVAGPTRYEIAVEVGK
jgi:hypothetical protein